MPQDKASNGLGGWAGFAEVVPAEGAGSSVLRYDDAMSCARHDMNEDNTSVPALPLWGSAVLFGVSTVPNRTVRHDAVNTNTLTKRRICHAGLRAFALNNESVRSV